MTTENQSPASAEDALRGWFIGRLPEGWFTSAPDIKVDREEITVVGTLADPEGVAALNHIVQATGARIVVTSTWREEYSLEELREHLARWGVTGAVIDQTPLAKTRGQEIQAWLEEHAVEKFVILDDDVDMGPLQAHLVKTETEVGLTMCEAEMAITRLNPPR